MIRSTAQSVKIVRLCVIGLVAFIIGASVVGAEPHFLIDSETEWLENLQQHIVPVIPPEWDSYIAQWNQQSWVEGQPYLNSELTQFSPAGLYVYPGDPSSEFPDEPGLVMAWGEESAGNYASAWKYDYGVDPDLSNSTIKVTVIPPSASGITAISFAIQDTAGKIRSWWWSLPSPAIPYDVPTTITINTALTGIAAASPVATGYLNNPAFDIRNTQAFLADENAMWVGGSLPVPPPGAIQQGLWNYWQNLVVTPNISDSKQLVTKWSQPPDEIEPALFKGWDEHSWYNEQGLIVADDWRCEDDRPVTDIHWWGSFLGWTQPHLPPEIPIAFHFGIWTDVPAGVDAPYSHPGELIWQGAYPWLEPAFAWNFAGYDWDPRGIMDNEACFQFNQDLPEEEWFYQQGGPNIYWLSIAAIYDPGVVPQYPWGWKTRPNFYNDDAVRIFIIEPWPPVVPGTIWLPGGGEPIEFPEGTSWDVAFELTTLPLDFGDAPDPTYPTLLVRDGARHVIGSGLSLGAGVDADADGQPNAAATGDDTDGNDDEDGVSVPSALVPGLSTTIVVTASGPGMLDAWIDFNANGSWADAGEQIAINLPLNPGPNPLSVLVPPNVSVGNTYARFRLSSQGGLSYTGLAPDGEVEDYLVTIVEPLDFGDAPDPPYPTLLASNGASHIITMLPTGAPFCLGNLIDPEPDGQPDAPATGDDTNGSADEDGVIVPSALVPGFSTTIIVTASGPGLLNAWLDFNGNGSWADAGEQIAVDLPLNPGPNPLLVLVPPNAVLGNTYARFRFSSQSGLLYTGLAPDGEVEDYRFTIVEEAVGDFGDAPDPTYPTLLASDGARHVNDGQTYLGALIDSELDGQPTANADGDDTNGGADEDGVTFLAPLMPGTTAGVNVTVSQTGRLNAWLDFNGDGDWADAGEQIFSDQGLGGGTTPLTIAVPTTASLGATYARFRFSSQSGLSYTGPAPDGEVEDYLVTIVAPEINLKQGSTNIPSGGSYDFGGVVVGQDKTVTFSIENLGTANLNLTGSPKVDISGTNAADFSVIGAQPSTPIAPSSSVTFNLKFAPGANGNRTASITIDNDDSDESSYTFTVTGTGAIQKSYLLWTR